MEQAVVYYIKRAHEDMPAKGVTYKTDLEFVSYRNSRCVFLVPPAIGVWVWGD